MNIAFILASIEEYIIQFTYINVQFVYKIVHSLNNQQYSNTFKDDNNIAINIFDNTLSTKLMSSTFETRQNFINIHKLDILVFFICFGYIMLHIAKVLFYFILIYIGLSIYKMYK